MRTPRLLAVLTACALAAGCSAKTGPTVSTSPAGSGSAAADSISSGSAGSGSAGVPSANPSEVSKGAAEAKRACAAFEQLIGYLGDKPVQLDLASQAVSTMTISAVGANGADSQRWQKLSDDVLKLLGSVTTGGSFNNPGSDDPEVSALREDCA